MHIDCHRRAVCKTNLFISANADCRSVSRGFAFAAPNCNHSLIAVGIDVETIIAGLQNRERLIRRVNFISLVIEQTPHVQIESSLMELELHHVLIDISDRQTALRTDADDTASHAEFSARVLVSPDIVSVCHWPVDLARDPIACALWLYGHRSVHISQACDTGRRIRSRWFGII